MSVVNQFWRGLCEQLIIAIGAVVVLLVGIIVIGFAAAITWAIWYWVLATTR